MSKIVFSDSDNKSKTVYSDSINIKKYQVRYNDVHDIA